MRNPRLIFANARTDIVMAALNHTHLITPQMHCDTFWGISKTAERTLLDSDQPCSHLGKLEKRSSPNRCMTLVISTP